jgi:hypothetical protein
MSRQTAPERRPIGLRSAAAEVLDMESLTQLPLSRARVKKKFGETLAIFFIFRQDGRFSS